MQYHTSEWLMNGILANYTAQDLVMGFNTSPIFSKINSGSTLNGNLYVSTEVTPLFNTQSGPLSNNEVTILTGADQIS